MFLERGIALRTYIDIALDTVDQAYNQLLSKLATHHTSKEISEYIKDVGSELETFLKEGIFNNSRNRDSLQKKINDLLNLGLSQISIDSFHDLRERYNEAKHDPAIIFNGLAITKLLRNTKTALEEMKTLNMGTTIKQQNYERFVWIASWDHLTTGDTEISIMIPYDGEGFPPSIDFFNISWVGWDEIVNKFVNSEELMMGKEHFPEKVYNTLNIEDFNDAGVFFGDYRELVLEISKYVDINDEKKLLPNLQRKNDPIAIYYALVYSVCDVISEGLFEENLDALTDAIHVISSYKYAVDDNSEYAKSLAPKLANILLELQPEHKEHITGPFFVSQEAFLSIKNSTYISHERPPIQVTIDGRLYSTLI